MEEKKWREKKKVSVASHLGAGLELLFSDGRPFWSPSLLLYKGRDEEALMSGVVDLDGEGRTGFEVDIRWSAMLVVILSPLWPAGTVSVVVRRFGWVAP